MGLIDIFNVVQAQLTETFAGFAPPLKVPKFLVGEFTRATEGDYPRIVWVPRVETIVMADAQGGDGIGNPKPLWKRSCRVEIDIWERDIPACEALANHLVAAIHAQTFGDYHVTGGVWDTDGLIQRGFLFILAVTFDIPFTRELDTVVPFVPGVETPIIITPVATG